MIIKSGRSQPAVRPNGINRARPSRWKSGKQEVVGLQIFHDAVVQGDRVAGGS
jgi:hypothetical protein